MKFTYTAYDPSGKAVSDAVEAATLAEASELVRRQGLFVTKIEADGTPGPAAAAGGRGARGGGGSGSKRLREVSNFVRQLSVLTSTGTPMVEAISSLEKQLQPGAWHAAVADIRGRLEQGASLSAALEHHPRYFNAVARSLIAAGESGGRLEDMLRRLSSLIRQQIKIVSSIRGAMVYPALVLTVASAVLVVMIVFVLPRFKGLFESLNTPLPPTTRLLMALSDFLRDYWWGVAPGLVVLGVGAWLGLRTPAAREMIDRAKVTLPPFGKVYRSFATARVCRILGVLVEGKVPLLDALKLTRESTGNALYERLVAAAEEAVTRGESVSNALDGSPLISRTVVEAIRSGERSGQVGPVLVQLAESMDEDNEIVLKSLSSIIEPLILMVLGVVIGFVAVSMFLPLFDIAGSAGGGGGGGG